MFRQIFRFFRADKQRIFFRRFHDNFEIETKVSQAYIKSSLKSNGIMYLDGHSCIISSCPFCKNKKIVKDSKLFINKMTGECAELQ